MDNIRTLNDQEHWAFAGTFQNS